VEFTISVNDLASRGIDKVKSSFDKLGISAKDLGKSLGMSEEAMAELAAETGGLSVVAAAAAAGLAVLIGGAIAITTEVISANEELDKMTTQLGALGNAADGSGADIVAMLDDMSARLPETKDQLAEWAKPLMAAGVHGEELQFQLEATASAAALMGETGASALQNMQRKIEAADESGGKLTIKMADLAKTGVNVTEVADRMGISTQTLQAQMKGGTVDAGKFGEALNSALIDKGKPAIEQANNSLESMQAHFKQSIGDLFEFTDADKAARDSQGKLNASIKDAIGLFDANSASGKAMHEAIMGVYEVTTDLATKAMPYLKHGFQEVEIGGLKLYIAVKPLIKQLGDLNDKVDLGGSLAFAASESFDLVVGSLSFFAGIATNTVAAINTIITAIQTVVEWADHAVTSVTNMGNALSNAVPGVGGGGKGGGGGGVLSAVAANLPHFADGGVVPGPTGAPSLAVVHGGETVTPVGGGAGGGVSVTFAPGAIQISGAGTSGEALELTEEALSATIERVVLSQGLGRTG